MSRPIALPSALAKPTFETRYHIDYEWWQRSGQELESYLVEHLCEEHRAALTVTGEWVGANSLVDWIDPRTGQVTRQNRLTYLLLSHCSLQPDYVTERTALVDGVFRVLLASGNRPMTPSEMSQRTGRSAETILRTLSGKTIYKGVRPVPES